MIVSLLAIICYLIASALSIRALYSVQNPWIERSVIVMALATHAAGIYSLIDTVHGQNLTFPNILTQVAWLIALFAFLLRFWKSDSPLGVLAYPFALFSLVLASVSPGVNMIATKDNFLGLSHILFAMLTFSVLCLAAMQAIVCVFQEQLLTRKEGFRFIGTMPPLQRSEKLLFQLIGTGFIFLSLLLFSSFYLFDNPFSPLLFQKTILAILAWLVFAILLFGRQYYGWRGANAMRYASAGVIILSLLILLSVLRG